MKIETKKIIARELLLVAMLFIFIAISWASIWSYSNYNEHRIEEFHINELGKIKPGDVVPNWDLPNARTSDIFKETNLIVFKISIILLLILYPLRFFILAIRWAINTLKQDSLTLKT